MTHPELHALLLYVEEDASVDREVIATHLKGCAECDTVLSEVRMIASLLAQPAVWEGDVEVTERADVRRAVLQLAETSQQLNVADAFVKMLLSKPGPSGMSSWMLILSTSPPVLHSGCLRRLKWRSTATLRKRCRSSMRRIE